MINIIHIFILYNYENMTSTAIKPGSPERYNCQPEHKLFVTHRITRKSTSKSVNNNFELQEDNNYLTPIPQQKKRNNGNTNTTIPEQATNAATKHQKLFKSPKFTSKNFTLLFDQDRPDGIEAFGEISNSKLEYQQPSRKNQATPSVQNEDQHTSSLHSLNANRKKKNSFIDSNFSYFEQRKSYRKILVRKQRDFVPYRRRQDSLEAKIVNIINKIIHGRVCNKQILNLSQKMTKLSSKDLLNKFIVSGFRKIVELVKVLDEDYEGNLMGKLEETEHKLKMMIQDELDNSEEYFEEQEEQEKISPKNIQHYMIRKIYALLRENKNKDKSQHLKSQAIEIYENFVNKDEELKGKNIIKLLQNIKHKQENY